jgi:biopolymer transport protein ExbB/TolQ
MFNFIFRAPAWQLVAQADTMTKFVLLALFSVSVFCVWIVICKFLDLFKQKKGMLELQKKIRSTRSLDDLVILSRQYREVAGGRLLLGALTELKNIADISGAKLSAKDLEELELLTDEQVDKVLAEEEKFLPVLGTSAAVAPLVGLFGTIWGLVHAFVDISQHKSADISVVAPGIAEALTTTLAGLIVAIPALIFFHYFSKELRRLELKLLSISDKFLSVVRRSI